jgi:hypothetical protein
VLGHDARGFLRERAAQILGAWDSFFMVRKSGRSALR